MNTARWKTKNRGKLKVLPRAHRKMGRRPVFVWESLVDRPVNDFVRFFHVPASYPRRVSRQTLKPPDAGYDFGHENLWFSINNAVGLMVITKKDSGHVIFCKPDIVLNNFLRHFRHAVLVDQHVEVLVRY